jgi:predicted protein tyrosine phosphatase
MFDIKICNLGNAPDHIVNWSTKAISLLDPDTTMAGFSPGPRHLILYFHDVAYTVAGFMAPTRKEFRKILEFSRSFVDEDRVLVHCHAGMSRSTAVAIAILINHGMDHVDAFNKVKVVRPMLWPNSLITKFTDDHFKLNGELIQLCETYKVEDLKTFAIQPDAGDIEQMRRWILSLDP